jgi:hypothetical protein
MFTVFFSAINIWLARIIGEGNALLIPMAVIQKESKQRLSVLETLKRRRKTRRKYKMAVTCISPCLAAAPLGVYAQWGIGPSLEGKAVRSSSLSAL